VTRAHTPYCARARVRSRPRRVDVVDDCDRPGRRGRGDDGTASVSTALREREPALSGKSPVTPEDVDHRELPRASESTRQTARGDVAAPSRPLRVAGNEDEGVADRFRDDLGDEARRLLRELPPTSLLPLADERPGASVVGDRGSGVGEGEPPPGAFRAATHRPRPRRAASSAHRLVQSNERGTAAVTERSAERAADSAPLGQEQLEHAAIVSCRRARVCVGSGSDVRHAAGEHHAHMRACQGT
jgi:hypothetical protein